jgi:hypothetical protein
MMGTWAKRRQRRSPFFSNPIGLSSAVGQRRQKKLDEAGWVRAARMDVPPAFSFCA